MAAGIPFSGLITTSAPSDTYAVTDALLGIDGLRSVPSKAARNAITTERRRQGMMVFCQDDGKYYSLNASPWAGTDSDWTLLNFGGGTSVQSQSFDFPNPVSDWVMDHTLGDRPIVITTDLSGNKIEGNVSYPSSTRVIVHHDVPGGVAGHAMLRTGN
jgi:hypothetical protein